MLNETFYLDGVDARSVGIHLQSPITFSEAVPIVEIEPIQGRNGDLVYYTGSYENRSGSASCFCLQKDVEKAISSAGRFLMGKKGYRRLETSDDPDHFWLARVENSPQIEQRLRTLAPFEIGFDCKPQRFVKSGQYPILITQKGYSLLNKYGEKALPFMTIRGNGSGVLNIPPYSVHFKDLEGLLYLDSETQNAYNEDGDQNDKIEAPDFPVLENGESIISWEGGIESVEIIPRWWEL